MDETPKKKRYRPDHDGTHRNAFERAKRRILASEGVCGICGLPVDKTLKYPDPMAPCIDHIIPIDRGGHPSDIANLQLAHWRCNRAKSDKLIFNPQKAIISSGLNLNSHDGPPPEKQTVDNSNRLLPLSMDWSTYRGSGSGST